MIASTRRAGGLVLRPEPSTSPTTDLVPLDIDVAVASDGALTAVWWDGTTNDPVASGVLAAHRAAGEQFGAVSDLTPDDPGSDGDDRVQPSRDRRQRRRRDGGVG